MLGTLLVLVVFTAFTALEAVVGPPGRRRPRRANLAAAVPVLIAGGVTDLLVVGATVVADDHEAGLIPWLGLRGAAAVVAGVLVLDLLAYLNHRVRHAVAPFWRLHRSHHTDTDVDVSTSLRFHPLDVVVLNVLLAATIAAFGIGAASVAIVAVLTPLVGIAVHARVRLPATLERRLALVIQTPGLHRVHHAPDQRRTDSNFGLLLTLWDRALGTYQPPDPDCEAGLDTVDLAERQSFRAMLAEPWRPLVKEEPRVAAEARVGG